MGPEESVTARRVEIVRLVARPVVVAVVGGPPGGPFWNESIPKQARTNWKTRLVLKLRWAK